MVAQQRRSTLSHPADQSHRLLGFWRAIELFAPQPWPDPDPSTGPHRLLRTSTPPWLVHSYAAYIGRVTLDRESATYLLSALILDDGTLVPGSVQLSERVAAIASAPDLASMELPASDHAGLSVFAKQVFDASNLSVGLDPDVVKIIDLGSVPPEQAGTLENGPELWRRRHEDAFDLAGDSPWPRRPVFRFRIHGGIDQGVAYDLLTARTGEVLNDAEREQIRERRPSGQASFLTFLVSDDGRAVAGSLKVSQHALALARTIHPGPRDPSWLDLCEFDGVLESLGETFDLKIAGVSSPELAEYRRIHGLNAGKLGHHRHVGLRGRGRAPAWIGFGARAAGRSSSL